MSFKTTEMSRRRVLGGGCALLAAAPGIGLVLPDRAHAQDAEVIIKYDWLISNGQIGDVVAAESGLFEEEGLSVSFSPGGPNSATVPPVLSGEAALGQFSETSQLFNARASGIPVKILACGYRTGPYAFASLPAAPIRSVEDLTGKRIGVQPTAAFIMDAIFAKNGIDPDDVTVISVGFDKAPLLEGEVDAIGGWITNTQALSILGPDRIDLLVRDLGLPSYANVYFATDDAVEKNSDILARFIRAVARGWEWTYNNPTEAVEMTVASHPSLDLEWELKTIDLILQMNFDDATAADGWGTFDPALLEEQLSIFDAIGQYEDGRPALEDVYTDTILSMTADARPKFGTPPG